MASPADEEARQQAFVRWIKPNLRALRWRDVAASARLVLAMVAEVALREHELGPKDRAGRRALRRPIRAQ